MDTKTKLSLGVPSRADVQDAMDKQYIDFLGLKIKIDDVVERRLKENPNIEVIYTWIDINSKKRMGKEILQVLKNEIEVLKHRGADAKDVTNIMLSYEGALNQAISDYVNSKSDYAIQTYITQMNRYLRENKYGAFNGICDLVNNRRIENVQRYSEIVDICKQIELIQLRLRNSEEWARAHKSRDIVNEKKNR